MILHWNKEIGQLEIREYTTYHEAEVVNLYSSVGWTAYTDDPDVLKKGLENSMLVLAAYEEDRLVGLIRAVGDGYTIVYIQDILVLPEYQRKGIGSLMIQTLLKRFRHVRQIFLSTDDTPETAAFYTSQGFRRFSEMGGSSYMRIAS